MLFDDQLFQGFRQLFQHFGRVRLHENTVHVLFAQQPVHRGRYRYQNGIILVAKRRGPFFRQHPDDPEVHQIDLDRFSDRIGVAEQFPRDGGPQQGDFLAQLHFFSRKKTSDARNGRAHGRVIDVHSFDLRIPVLVAVNHLSPAGHIRTDPPDVLCHPADDLHVLESKPRHRTGLHGNAA